MVTPDRLVSERGDGVAAEGNAATEAEPGRWVLLAYRLPREPSSPRIAVWRKLKRLGVAQLSDGLVALPADPRTREALEWVGQEVREADGHAELWLAEPGEPAQQQRLAAELAAARAAEYQSVAAEAQQAWQLPPAGRRRVGQRLRAELGRIARRDFFPPPERDTAQAAVQALLAAEDDTAEVPR
jgi:hypothetical protein